MSKLEAHHQRLFWGCFIALITTAFGFISRMFLITEWAAEFHLDDAQAGRLAGIGIWPFAASIILFSLFIDRIGYKVAMVFSFVGYIIWSIMGVGAFFVSRGADGNLDLGFQLLYWGSLILGLSNGTVEAYINPVVATIFSTNKTKWLNILHAGWPGGLVIAGLLTIAIGNVDWWIRIAIIAPPAIVFFVMLIGETFPVQERVASGVTYKEMLSEFGVLTAIVVGVLITLQLMDFFRPSEALGYGLCIAAGVAFVVAFGVYTRKLGNPLLVVLALIMMPLATTEIGTDGWIEGILRGVVQNEDGTNKFHPGLVLVYTSFIMMVLRFCAGPIVHRISPLGLLLVSSVLAVIGLYSLSITAGMMIFVAATIYAFGKTFFWPTMLGIASEQTPKGGALTLNTLGGVGMLAVGTLGFPFIGALQANERIEAIESSEVAAAVPGLVENGELTVTAPEKIYEVIPYTVVDEAKLDALLAPLPESERASVEAKIGDVSARSTQRALAWMAVFPGIMVAAYIGLIIYFRSKGGYKPMVIGEHQTGEADLPAATR
jgi:MFS family permease